MIKKLRHAVAFPFVLTGAAMAVVGVSIFILGAYIAGQGSKEETVEPLEDLLGFFKRKG